MTPAEERFRVAVQALVLQDIYPSAANIYRALGRPVRPHRDMNGRELLWRAWELGHLGWTYVGGVPAWRAP